MSYARPISTDPASEDQILLDLLGTGNRILELGCYDGHFSVAAQRAGNVVVGLDINADAIATAQSRGVDASVADLNRPRSLPTGELFDVVVASNVLEHLADPDRVLREARECVTAGGRLLVSVPNVAHFSVRLALLRGRFKYEDAGLMDRTHLRFYTRATLRAALEGAGWRIENERASPGLVAGRLRRDGLRFLTRAAPSLFAVHLVAGARR